MGYPVPANAPTFTVGEKKYAIGAFQWSNPLRTEYMIGLYELTTNGAWNMVGNPCVWGQETNDLVNLVKAKGGMVKFMEWLTTELNKSMNSTFNTSTPLPTTEPTTDVEAVNAIAAYLSTMKVTIVNGVPVLSK